ncbi:MAG TPA: ferredoxin [Streptosporangiaceae bacterium]|jgi:ferredoxin
MRVSVDQDRCIASGQCVRTAAGVFDQREEDGIVTLQVDSPPAPVEKDVRLAAAICPAQAIAISET